MPTRPHMCAHYYLNHPPTEFIAIRKTRMLNTRLPQTTTLEESDDIIQNDDMDEAWMREQMKSNFWQLLKNMKSEESKEFEHDKYLTNAMHLLRKYLRTT